MAINGTRLNRPGNRISLRRRTLLGAPIAMLLPASVHAGIPSALKNAADIPPGPALPIDGVWRLRVNDVRYRFEGGRVWTEQDYFDFPFDIKAGNVLVTDLTRIAPRFYQGYENRWLSDYRAEVNRNGTLTATMRAGFKTLKLIADPVRIDNVDAFRAEVELAPHETELDPD